MSDQNAGANWCVFKQIGSGYQMCIARLRTRSEAEKHYASLKSLMPDSRLTLAYSEKDLHKLHH